MLKSRIERSLPSVFKPQGFNAICTHFYHQQNFLPDEGDKIKFLIVDCSALAYCDCSGIATLVEIVDELAELDVQVYLAACPIKLIDTLERMQATQVLQRNVFPSISDAVAQAQRHNRLQFSLSSSFVQVTSKASL